MSQTFWNRVSVAKDYIMACAKTELQRFASEVQWKFIKWYNI